MRPLSHYHAIKDVMDKITAGDDELCDLVKKIEMLIALSDEDASSLALRRTVYMFSSGQFVPSNVTLDAYDVLLVAGHSSTPVIQDMFTQAIYSAGNSWS